jgi:hypothetical protein
MAESQIPSQISVGKGDHPQTSSFLCLSQESSAPKSLGAEDPSRCYDSVTAPTPGEWIPVTSTGMREREATTSHLSYVEGAI